MVYSLRKISLIVIMTVVIMTTNFLQGSEETSISNECYEIPYEPDFCCWESCGQIFVEGQLLYLRAFEEGLSSVCDNTQISDSIVNGVLVSTLNGEAHDPDFQWGFGFNIGVGYEFPDSDCDIGIYWTYYNSHTNGDSHNNNHYWKINFNVVDLLYECDYNFLDCFILTPYGGLRYASIDQRLNTNLSSTINGSLLRSIGSFDEDFFGIGPIFGIEGDGLIGCGFSLYGYISTAILYGTFDVKSHQTETSSSGININRLKKHIHPSQFVLDAGAGIRWETCLCDYLLVLQLGLEQYRYFNHNQFCSYGDLSLSGVTLGAGLQF